MMNVKENDLSLSKYDLDRYVKIGNKKYYAHCINAEATLISESSDVVLDSIPFARLFFPPIPIFGWQICFNYELSNNEDNHKIAKVLVGEFSELTDYNVSTIKNIEKMSQREFNKFFKTNLIDIKSK